MEGCMFADHQRISSNCPSFVIEFKYLQIYLDRTTVLAGTDPMPLMELSAGIGPFAAFKDAPAVAYHSMFSLSRNCAMGWIWWRPAP